MRSFVAGAAVAAVAAAAVFAPQLAGQARAQDTTALYALRTLGAATSIGVTVRDLSNEEIAQVGLPQPGGVRIEQVLDGTPAADAGLRVGDFVIEFDGERVRSAREFARLVEETPAGRTVTASVVRGGERLTVEVAPRAGGQHRLSLPAVRQHFNRTLEPLSRLTGDTAQTFFSTRTGRLGATLMPLEGQLRDYFGVSAGVLVSSVSADTPAADAGLRAGDVITAVNGRRVTTVNDVSRAVREASAGSSIELQVTRDRQETTMTATLR
jgi:serine protease Do